MKNKILNLSFLCFILFLMLLSIDINSFNNSFYKKEYAKLNVAENIGMSNEDLHNVTNKLLNYIKDKEDNINIQVTIKNKSQEVFNEKEKAHMIDVKNLYLSAMMFKNIFLISSVIFLLLYYFLNKKIDFYILHKQYNKVILSLSIFLFFLAFYAFIDFDTFWLNFHYIFFSNDLFLLNPNTDILIQMVPLQFFMDLVFNIVVHFILYVLFSNTALYLLRRN